MVEASELIRCSKPDCQVATTGVCAEGHDPLESCPFFGQSKEVDLSAEAGFDNDEEGTEPNLIGDQVNLASGEGLTTAEVDTFLRWRNVSLIAIVGDQESGKTTLICSLYDRFLRGGFGGCLFTSSRTLIELERRSFYSRVESGLVHPDTARTSIPEGLKFFHFGVTPDTEPTKRIDLMLSDRAGESYRMARSNSSLIPGLIEIHKAKKIVILLDGNRITDATQRPGSIQAVRQTIRAFLDSGSIGDSSSVQVVTTKVDLIQRAVKADLISEQLQEFQARLATDFGPRLFSLTFWDIAARDPLGRMEPAYGVSALFQDWLAEDTRPLNRTNLIAPRGREIDQFLNRIEPGVGL